MSGKHPSTSCKEAIAKWSAKNGVKAAEATVVKLICQLPSITKMDHALNGLTACEHLSMSTNAIEKLFPLQLKNLKILSLGRNNIKKFEKLDELAPTLEELWMSHNSIEKLDGLSNLKNLRVLYLSNNKVKNWDELAKLQSNPKLEDLLLVGNPIYDSIQSRTDLLARVLKYLPNLKKLDGQMITNKDRKEAGVDLEEEKE